MGASRERKKRQEYYAGGGVDKKAIREAEEKAKLKSFNTKLAISAAVFVVLTAFLLVYNSGIFHRDNIAVTIGDKSYTAADYSYHYYNIYNAYYQQYGEMASYVIGDLDTIVVEQLKLITASVNAAEEEGFTLPQEKEETIQATLDQLKTGAKNNGISYKSYVKRMYGKLVSPEVLERNLRDAVIASAYSDAYASTLVYSDEKITEVYEGSPDTYDEVNGYLVSVSATPEAKTDADGNTIEATDAEKDAAMAAAQETAEAILAAYKDGGDLEALAKEHNATYSALDGHRLSAGIEYSEWLFEDGRKSGDCTAVGGSSSWFVVVFTDRYRNETTSVNVRHILLSKNRNNGEVISDAVLEQTAELMMSDWDGTEEGFAALAKINSADGGSAANGGLYEDILPTTNFVPEFLDWCFAEGREPGNTGIIHTEHGCHIMYFSGHGDLVTWKEAVRTALYNADYATWETALLEGYTATTDEKVMASINY